MQTGPLTNEIILALAKYLKDDGDVYSRNREEIKPGKYTLDEKITLTLKGVLKVGADTLFTPTPKLSGLKILVAMRMILANEGLSSQKITYLLGHAIDLALEDSSDKTPEEHKDLEEIVQATQKRIASKLEKEPRRGSVSFNGVIEGERKPAIAHRTTVV